MLEKNIGMNLCLSKNTCSTKWLKWPFVVKSTPSSFGHGQVWPIKTPTSVALTYTKPFSFIHVLILKISTEGLVEIPFIA